MNKSFYFIKIIGFFYKTLLKRIFFCFDAEKVHISMVSLGENLGQNKIIAKIAPSFLIIKNNVLKQQIAGINFENPIGLAAGFDYEGRLTQILPKIGFGFETCGTITYSSYSGNPAPRLGRLPKSKSLMVNKGFKNLGATETIKRLDNLKFNFPVGISIGRSNIPSCDTNAKSINDIIKTFLLFEKSSIKNSYYELNISCPNLFGNVNFYSPKNLRNLLLEIDKLHLTKPLFVKMPIGQPEKNVIELLSLIANFCPKGIIFGNLQKDNRKLHLSERLKFKVGGFSGKPTFDRSNELIKLTYKNYKKRFIIIGCGGIFCTKDAYEKISNGASLVQLITGMIYNGPQLAFQINYELILLLKSLGFKNIKDTIGSNC